MEQEPQKDVVSIEDLMDLDENLEFDTDIDSDFNDDDVEFSINYKGKEIAIKGRSYVVWGDVSTGKTTVVSYIANRLFSQDLIDAAFIITAVEDENYAQVISKPLGNWMSEVDILQILASTTADQPIDDTLTTITQLINEMTNVGRILVWIDNPYFYHGNMFKLLMEYLIGQQEIFYHQDMFYAVCARETNDERISHIGTVANSQTIDTLIHLY